MVRRLDELGRVVIPIEFRNINNWKVRDQIEMIENGEELILRKYNSVYCKKCNTSISKNDKYCRNCGEKV